jgi:hypothetical protein
LDVGQGFPGVETFPHKEVEILLKAKALEIGCKIAHSSGRGVSSAQRRRRLASAKVAWQWSLMELLNPDDMLRKLYGDPVDVLPSLACVPVGFVEEAQIPT